MNPTLKRITRADLGDAPGWSEKLLLTLNSFMDKVSATLRNGLTFQENIQCEIKELTLRAPIASFSIPTKLKTPIGVLLLSIEGKDFTGNPVLKWTPSQKAVLIDSISELTATNEYKVRILIV